MDRSARPVVSGWVATAIAQGQLPPRTDPATVVGAVAAPLFFALLVARRPLDDAIADRAARDSLVLVLVLVLARHRPRSG